MHAFRFFRAGGLRPHLAPQLMLPLSLQTLRLLRKAADAFGLFLAAEVAESSQISMLDEHADLLLAGSRNMQNYALLQAVGRAVAVDPDARLIERWRPDDLRPEILDSLAPWGPDGEALVSLDLAGVFGPLE